MNTAVKLPNPPDHLSPGTILQRLVDGSGFRYNLATKDLRDEDLDFRPVASSMSIFELNKHIYHLYRLTTISLGINWNSKPDDNFVSYRDLTFQLISAISERLSAITDEELEQVNIHLKRIEKDFPHWYLINGFLADALTHIGQMISWRRINGNPVDRISPFTGEPF